MTGIAGPAASQTRFIAETRGKEAVVSKKRFVPRHIEFLMGLLLGLLWAAMAGLAFQDMLQGRR